MRPGGRAGDIAGHHDDRGADVTRSPYSTIRRIGLGARKIRGDSGDGRSDPRFPLPLPRLIFVVREYG